MRDLPTEIRRTPEPLYNPESLVRGDNGYDIVRKQRSISFFTSVSQRFGGTRSVIERDEIHPVPSIFR